MSHAKHSHPKKVALPKGALLLKLLSAFCVINSVGATAVPALNGGAATADPSPTSSSPLPHYTLMNDALSWDDANAACLAAGLQLATVQSKRDRRRRRTGVGGMRWGVNLHFRSFARGVSVLQPLIGSLVECCSVLTSVSLSQHRNIVRTSVMLCRVCSVELHTSLVVVSVTLNCATSPD